MNVYIGILQLGYDPTTATNEPRYRVVDIVSAECRVFRTKARAPSLIICIVKRDDAEYRINSTHHGVEGGISSPGAKDNAPGNRNHRRPRGLSACDNGVYDSVYKELHVMKEHSSGNAYETPGGLESGKEQSTAANLPNEPEAGLNLNETFADVVDVIIDDKLMIQTLHHLRSQDPASLTVSGSNIHSPEDGNATNGNNIIPADSASTMIRSLQGSNSNPNTTTSPPPTVVNLNSSTSVPTPPSVLHTSTNPNTPPPPASSSSSSNMHTPLIHSTSSSNLKLLIDRPSSILSANRKGSLFGGSAESQQMTITEYITSLDTGAANNSTSEGRKSDVKKGPSVSIVLPEDDITHEMGGNRVNLAHTPPPELPPTPIAYLDNGEVSGEKVRTTSISFSEVTNVIPCDVEGDGILSPICADQSPIPLSVDTTNSNNIDVTTAATNTVTTTSTANVSTTATTTLALPELNPDTPTDMMLHIRRSQQVQGHALKLYESGRIDQQEYYKLINSDLQYRDETVREEAIQATKLVNNSFGELWYNKKLRLLGEKRVHKNKLDQEMMMQEQADAVQRGGMDVPVKLYFPLYDLRGFIVKSNDDLRQEVCCLQVMTLFREIFHDMGITKQLWLKPYRILSTSKYY